MKNILKTAFLLLLLPLVVNAQKRESVLWEVSGNGLSKKSYLFGVEHTASDRILQRFPGLISLIRKSDFGLFELKKGLPESSSAPSEINDHEPPLDSILTKSEYALVDSFYTASPFGGIKPHNNDASIAGLAQFAILLKEHNNKQVTLLDDSIQQFMIKLKKNTYQLDNDNDSTRRAINSNYRAWAELLIYVIKKKPEPARQNSADMQYETTLSTQWPQRAYPYIKGLTAKRNLIWLPKIITRMKLGSCFIAVGGGHLPYKTGLITLLKQRGYMVKPLRLKKKIFRKID